MPVFRALAARPGVRLKVTYGDVPGLANVAAEGFDADYRPSRPVRVFGRTLQWFPHNRRLSDQIEGGADAVIMTWNVNDLSLVPGLLAARRRGVGTVVWGHGFGQPESAARRAPRDVIGRLADAVVVYDKNTAADLARRGFDPARVFVAQNALDEAAIRAARQRWLDRPAELAAWQEERDLAGRPVVLFVSRLTEKSRYPLLLEAAAKLGDIQGLRVVIVGGGDLDAARARADALGLNERVQFTGPIYDEDELAPYFLTAACMCYPAGIGLSVIHAFGYGLPIVTGDDMSRHNPEIAAVRAGENGLLFRDADPADLAAKLRQILTDEDLRARLAAAAEATVTDDFNLQTMVDGLENAARHAAARRTPCGPRHCKDAVAPRGFSDAT